MKDEPELLAKTSEAIRDAAAGDKSIDGSEACATRLGACSRKGEPEVDVVDIGGELAVSAGENGVLKQPVEGEEQAA